MLKGVLVEFSSPADVYHAAETLRDAGYKNFEVYSPFPIHGMDQAMGLKPSPLGWIVLCGGAFGLMAGIGLQTWVATTAYRLVISGKPFFSYPAFVPVTFELMVLFSAFSAVFGMLYLNKLPQHFFSYFKSKNIRRATSHGFFISVDSVDPLFNQETISQFLSAQGGKNVEFIEE